MAEECRVDIDVPSSSNDTEWSLDFIISKIIQETYFDASGSFYEYREEVLNIGRDLKIKLMKKFIDSFSKDKTGKGLFDAVNENVVELRKLGNDTRKNTVEDFELAVTLFLDGCAVLQFMHSYLNKKLEELEIGIVLRRDMRDDVFEGTQIPFRVLELLVNSTNDADKLKTDVVSFIHINNITKVSQSQAMSSATSLAQWNDIVKIRNQDLHVVDLQYLLYLLITSPDGQIVSANINRENEEDTHRHVLCVPCFCWKRSKSKDQVATGYDITDNHGFFRNVEELKSAGIEFKPSGCSLADISFSDKCCHLKGHLKLPPLIMDERTRNKLVALVEYEKSINDKRYVVTSYLKFMDILIDSEDDVKELRASKILQNRLSSDKDVANWINEFGSKLGEPPRDFYSKVKTQIQTHCGRQGAIWMSQMCRQHCSSPWAIIGLVAAVIVLSLTAIQTAFAINPKN